MTLEEAIKTVENYRIINGTGTLSQALQCSFAILDELYETQCMLEEWKARANSLIQHIDHTEA